MPRAWRSPWLVKNISEIHFYDTDQMRLQTYVCIFIFTLQKNFDEDLAPELRPGCWRQNARFLPLGNLCQFLSAELAPISLSGTGADSNLGSRCGFQYKASAGSIVESRCGISVYKLPAPGCIIDATENYFYSSPNISRKPS